MAKKLSKKDVEKIIDLGAFNNLDAEQVRKFINLIPNMKNGVAAGFLENFPVFAEIAQNILQSLSSILDGLTSKNNKIQEEAIQTHKAIIDELSSISRDENISPELKVHLIDRMCDEAAKIDKLALSHQNFILTIFEWIVFILVIVLSGGLAIPLLFRRDGRINCPPWNKSAKQLKESD